MDNETKPLTGKKVIILGGSAGIGLATAKLAAAEGANIVIVSSNQQRINKALGELPLGSAGFAVDLSREENIKTLFGNIGTFDHLVYTAGENISLDIIARTEIASAQKFFNIRFWAAFAAVKYGAPNINTGGSVCLISGTAAERPGAGWSVATSICSAMEGFTRAMAVELAPLRVNCVMPGVIKTNLWDSMSDEDREALYKATEETLLLKRVGLAEDVALAFVYLMKQKHSTGQNVIVDGGSLLV